MTHRILASRHSHRTGRKSTLVVSSLSSSSSSSAPHLAPRPPLLVLRSSRISGLPGSPAHHPPFHSKTLPGRTTGPPPLRVDDSLNVDSTLRVDGSHHVDGSLDSVNPSTRRITPTRLVSSSGENTRRRRFPGSWYRRPSDFGYRRRFASTRNPGDNDALCRKSAFERGRRRTGV